MKRRSVPDSEYKLIILYTLSRLGPVNGTQLLQFLVELDLMNYFSMQLNLSEMIEQGQVEEQSHPLGTLLALSGKGAFTLSSFDHRIPSSQRQLIDEKAPAWHERFRMEQQTLAESFCLSNGRRCVRLRLLEADTTLLDVMLTLDSAAFIPHLQDRWLKMAQAAYAVISNTLGTGFNLTIPLPPLPENAALQQTGNGEWMLSLADVIPQPCFTLMLSLPDEHLALHYAACWRTCCHTLRAQLLSMLEKSEAKREEAHDV